MGGTSPTAYQHPPEKCLLHTIASVSKLVRFNRFNHTGRSTCFFFDLMNEPGKLLCSTVSYNRTLNHPRSSTRVVSTIKGVKCFCTCSNRLTSIIALVFWRQNFRFIMEIPYFVKELIELSLMMRAKDQWAARQVNNECVFWQPWLDKDESNKQLNKQTTKWKRDRRRLPEYSRKSDPKVPETLGVEPSSPEASISNCPTNPNSCHGNKRDEILHGGDTPLDMTVRQRGEPPSYAQTISNPGYRSSYRTTVMNNGVPPVINRDTLPSGISMCDTVIEEHFRRSLGQDYNAIFQNNNAAKEKEIQSKSPHRASSIVEFMDESGLSVDDHFAKALGETWKQLNKKETINNRENETSLVSAKN